MNRAERRHHVERRKAAVRKRLARWFGVPVESLDPGRVGKHAGVRRHCSCWICSRKDGGACASSRRAKINRGWDDEGTEAP